jgi:uncharacterized protein YcbK (DUF882 family)
MNELLNNKYDLDDQNDEIKENLEELLEKINKIRDLYGKPMTVTSGLRSMADHKRIYAAKGITDESKIPMKSKHLYGQAVDISDPNKELQNWCKQNESELKDIGVWLEDFAATKNWCHFQIVPYGSWKAGKSIWFVP